MKFLKKTGNRGEIAKLQEERRQVREQMEAYEIQQEKLWKAQQELLEKRLKEQEEKLQEANVRLAGYEELPMKEQELDRLREQIFRFQAAQEREQTAKQQYMQAQKQEERRKAELEEVRECAQEQKYSDRKWMLTGVTGLIVMLTGMVLMVCCFSDIIFMTALFGILILLGLASTITSFLQLFRNQRSCHLAKEIYNQRVAELQQYQKQSKQLKKQWDEAEAERKEQEQDPILQSFGKQRAMSWSSFQTERYWSSAGSGNGSGAGSFRIYVRAVRIIEKRYGSVSRNWIPMNSRENMWDRRRFVWNWKKN